MTSNAEILRARLERSSLSVCSEPVSPDSSIASIPSISDLGLKARYDFTKSPRRVNSPRAPLAERATSSAANIPLNIVAGKNTANPVKAAVVPAQVPHKSRLSPQPKFPNSTTRPKTPTTSLHSIVSNAAPSAHPTPPPTTIADYSARLSASEIMLAEARSQASDLRSKLDDFRKYHESVIASMSSNDVPPSTVPESASVAARIEQLESDLASKVAEVEMAEGMIESVETLEDEKSTLEKDKANLDRELTELKSSISEYDVKMTAMEEKETELRGQLSGALRSAEELRGTVGESQTNLLKSETAVKELRRELEKAKNEVQSDAGEKDARISVLEGEVETMRREAERLKVEMDGIEEGKDSEISVLNDTLTKRDDEIGRLNEAADELKAEKVNLTGRVEEMERELEEKGNLKLEIERMRGELAKAVERELALSQEASSAAEKSAAQVRKLEAEVDRLCLLSEGPLNTLEVELEEKQAEVMEVGMQLEAASERVSALEIENEGLKAEITSVGSRIVEAEELSRDRMTELEELKGRSQHQLHQLETKFETVKRERDEAMEEIDNVRVEVNAAEGDRDDAVQKVTVLESDLEKEIQRADSAEEEAKDLRVKVEGLQAALNSMECTIESTKDLIEDVTANTREEFESTIQDLEDEIKRLNNASGEVESGSRVAMRVEIQDLKGRVAELEGKQAAAMKLVEASAVKIEQQKKVVAEARGDVEHAKDLEAELTTKIEELERQLELASDRKGVIDEEMKVKMEKLEDDLELAEVEKSIFENDLESTKADVIRLHGEIAELGDAAEGAKAEIERLRAELKVQEQESNESKDAPSQTDNGPPEDNPRVRALEAELVSVRGEMDSAKEEMRRLSDEAAKKAEEKDGRVKQLEAENKELKSVKSEEIMELDGLEKIMYEQFHKYGDKRWKTEK